MGDIQVEAFDKSFTNDGENHTLANDVGSVGNAFVLNLTARRTSGGPTGSTGNTNWDDFVAAVRLTDTNELTFYRPAAGAGEIRMMGEVWRYTGSGGGSHEFIKRWSGEITIASGNSTADQAVADVADVNKVVCFVTGVEASLASRSNGNRVIATARMTASDNVQVERGETGTAVTVHVEVVEFMGSAWSIGFFDSGVIGSGNTSTPTLNDQYDYGGSSFTVSDWTTAFIWADMLGDVTGANHALEDTWFVVEDNTSTTVLITLDSSAVVGEVRGYVIQNDGLSVERETASKAIPAGLDTSLTDPSNITTADERSIAECYVFSDGGGTAYARGAVAFKLNGAAVEAWVHRSGNTGTYRYAGIDLSELSGVQVFTYTAGGEVVATGAAALAKTKDYDGSGEVTATGAATTEKITVFLYSGSGQVVVSGAASLQITYDYVGSGEIAVSGAATTTAIVTREYTGSGQTFVSGTAEIHSRIDSGASLIAPGYTAYKYYPRGYKADNYYHDYGTPDETQEFVYSGSGQVTVSGAAELQITYDYVGSGQVAVSGAAGLQITYDYEGSGQVTVTGTATSLFIDISEYVGSGQVMVSGAATVSHTKAYSGSGQVAVSGSASLQVTYDYVSSGQTTVSGAATTEKITVFGYVGSGEVVTSGAADLAKTKVYTGSGQTMVSGSATTSYVSVGSYEYAGSGQIRVSGAAGLQITYVYIGSGSAEVTGAASASKVKSYVGSGQVVVSGAAVTSKAFVFTYIASGETAVSGSASLAKTKVYGGSGQVLVSGAAGKAKGKRYQASGGRATVSGAAVTSYVPSGTFIYVGSGQVVVSGTGSYESVLTAPPAAAPPEQVEPPIGGGVGTWRWPLPPELEEELEKLPNIYTYVSVGEGGLPTYFGAALVSFEGEALEESFTIIIPDEVPVTFIVKLPTHEEWLRQAAVKKFIEERRFQAVRKNVIGNFVEFRKAKRMKGKAVNKFVTGKRKEKSRAMAAKRFVEKKKKVA